MSGMIQVFRAAALAAVLLFASAASSCAEPAPRASARTAAAPTVKTEVATFAGGCFWSVESAFEGMPGVLSVVSGFTGGRTANPSYAEVSAGGTGHAESVEIRFDPQRVRYEQLLDRFWHFIDPMQVNGQICDHGDEYRTAIFWHDEAQRAAAEVSKKQIAASGRLPRPIATEITRATAFYPAEEYHQDFAKRNPGHYNAYRQGCGRDRRLDAIWGKSAVHPVTH